VVNGSKNPGINAISEPGGMVISYDENEQPISIEFLNASKRELINPQNLQLTISQQLTSGKWFQI